MRLSRLRRMHADFHPDMLQRNRDLFQGGANFAKNVSNYLYKNEQEPADIYSKRCKIAADAYVNYCGPIGNYFASWLMTSSPEMESDPADVDEFYHEFKEDCDAKGTDLEHFIRHRFIDTLVDKRSYWRVEFPTTPPEGALPGVLKEWQEQGLGRAVLCHIPASNIVNWLKDDEGYVWLLEYCKKQGLEDIDDEFETICETWTIWKRDGQHCRYELRYNEQTKPTGETEVPEVELEPTWGQIQGIPIIEMALPDELWLMNLIAGPQLENWRKRVGLSWSIDRTNYAMPVFNLKDKKKPPRMGAGYYLMLGLDEKVEYISPNPGTYEVTHRYIDSLKDEIHRVTQQMARGIDNNAAAVGRSAGSKDADDRQTEIVLSGFGMHVRDAIERTLDMISEGRGEDITWIISGLDNYHVTDATAFITNAGLAQQIDIPSQTHKREMAKRASRVQLPDLSEPIRQQIDEELESAIAPEPEEETLAPEAAAKMVEYTTKAQAAGLLSTGTGVKHLSSVFGHDPAAEKGAIDKEAAQQTEYGPMLSKNKGPGDDQGGGEGEGELAGQVYEMMSEDFPPENLAWVKTTNWSGPTDVPLDQIDYSKSAQWQASKEPDKVQGFVDKIQANNRKPVVLLQGPDGGKYRVIDGHHRSLAYQKLGQPVRAYVGKTSDSGAFQQALEVHVAQYEDTKFQG